MCLQALRSDLQEVVQHHVERYSIALHKVAQPLWHGEHPLAHRRARENMIRQVCRRRHHAPGVAREANATAFKGIGDEVVMTTIVTPGYDEAVREDAAFEVFEKLLAHMGLWGVVVAPENSLSPVVPFGQVILGQGEQVAGQIQLTHTLALGHDKAFLKQLAGPFDFAWRGSMG